MTLSQFVNYRVLKRKHRIALPASIAPHSSTSQRLTATSVQRPRSCRLHKAGRGGPSRVDTLGSRKRDAPLLRCTPVARLVPVPTHTPRATSQPVQRPAAAAAAGGDPNHILTSRIARRLPARPTACRPADQPSDTHDTHTGVPGRNDAAASRRWSGTESDLYPAAAALTQRSDRER